MDIRNKKICILGAKRSGFSLAKLALDLGGVPKISDISSFESQSEEFKVCVLNNKIETEFGAHTKEFVQDCEIVVISPGVKINSEVVTWAHQADVPVLGEIEFAYQYCKKPIIAVTGSNGKTTVVNLIHQILMEAGYKSCLCGNVGYPFSEYVLDLDKKDYVVLEISSFQMESLLEPDSIFRSHQNQKGICVDGFKPFIAVMLNICENHLDRHRDMEEYFWAKRRIFLNQTSEDFAVINYQNPEIRKLEEKLTSQIVHFNSPDVLEKLESTNPNHLAVLKVAQILNISFETCHRVFENFKGVEHRLEFVKKISGVDYINDSKATTAEASRWAIENINQPIILLSGGRDKNIDFSQIKDAFGSKVKKLIAFGEAKEKVAESFSDVVEVEQCASLKDAVFKARDVAVEGDCVVLSPMCASFDEFKDYEERGRVYKSIVESMHP